MRTEDTLEYNSLRWVKKELDLILHEAQAALSAYIEDTGEVDRLRECIEHLHMVHGTLQMVELYGAAQLAEEMEYVAAAILKGELEKTDDAYDVLMRAMLQLPDYLESLQAGNKDVPMVLLPLLNDLRASRNAGLLSENVLFFPNLEGEEAAEEIEISAPAAPAGALLSLAKKLRPHFQVGLVGWFKGDKPVASLKRIQAVLAELEKNSAQNSTRRVWTISSALTEGLLNEAVDVNVSIKMLMGQVDRSIKQLIDQGEDAFARKIPAELLKNLLYYIARVNQDSPRVAQVKQTYRLAELLPGDAELEEARSGLGGLNIELLRTVSQGIREDLLEVKDALEIFVHSESRDPARLSGMPELLNKIADTLSMLGLGAAREQILSQRDKVKRLETADAKTVENDVMAIAGVLLSVEAQLNSFIASRSGMSDKTGQKRFSELSAMPESEYQEVLNAVIREALQDFSDARQAILGFLENPNDKELLNQVQARLEEVSGAMFMLPVQNLHPQLQALKDYVARTLIQGGQVPDRKTQDDLADVITSIEYYLEAIVEGRPDLELSLNTGDRAAQRLNAISAGVAPVAVPAPATAKPAAAETARPAPKPAKIEVEAPATPAAATVKPVAPAAPKPKAAPVPSAAPKRDLKILGDDADEEILEIFIEESLEELASLNEQYPIWKNDPGNTEALTTIRRSFHTLKGSGRLIGAELIGEFSWAFENMLNRVLDRSRPANQEVFDVLDESLSVLPQLIEQLKGNREPIPNVYELIQRADTLSKWRPNSAAEDAAEAKPAPQPEAPKVAEPQQEAQAETDMMDFSESGMLDESVIDIGSEQLAELDIAAENFGRAGAAPEDIGEIKIDENFDIDLTRDLQDLQVSLAPDDNALEIDAIGMGDALTLDTGEDIMSSEDILDIGAMELSSDSDMLSLDEGVELTPAMVSEQDEPQGIHADPVLFQIFKNESENHLRQIRAWLDAHYESRKPLLVSQDLIRALHTLFGSARTADVSEIAELCGEMEKCARLYQELNVAELSKDGVRVLDDLHHVVSHMLDSLADPQKRLHRDTALLKRIHDLSAALNAQVSVAPAAAPAPVAQPAAPAAKPKVAAAKPQIEEKLVSYSAVDDELVDIFLEEAEELIDGCENSLQRWNNNNNDTESVMDLQRQLHTLKGGARMADLTPIGNLTHSLESLIISVNEGQLAFTKDMSHVLHDAMDRLSDMLNKVKARKPIPTAENMIAHIEALRRGETPAKPKKPDADDEEESEPAEPAESDAEFVLEDEAETVTAPEQLLSIDESVEPETDDATFSLELTEESLLGEVEPDFAISPEDLQIEESDEPAELVIEDDSAVAGMFETPVLEEEPVAVAANEEPSTLKLSKEDKIAPEPQTEEAKGGMATEQVRVRADLLNELVNNASEVSVYHARMGQQVSKFAFNLSEMDQTVLRLREQLRKLSIETEAQILSRYEKEADQYDEHFDPLEMDRFSTMQQLSRSLQETVGDIDSIRDILSDGVRDAETLLLQESRVSTELQEGLLRTRMVHFGGLTSRLRRIVRQTARELEKDVDLEIIGEANEVDRTVLDRIVAPLEHMLRNAVSHGIELPAVRRANGKSENGHINIVVDRLGGEVIMKVTDDGRGIDIAAVRKRAIERGMLSAESAISDREALQFIMQPGFSTAEKVTQISGRGVGMDVVDREIKQLGGVLEIDTVPGKGTIFTIHLPLTLAINHALMVSVNDEVYAVPLNSIEGVVRISGPELQMFYNSGDANYEFAGTKYQLKHLGKLLLGQQPDYSRSGQLFPVLLARVGEQRIALHVDDLLGRREVVVKPVGPQISTVRGISGATILGDGRVVLILEMSSLLLGGESLIHIGEAEQVVEAAPIVVIEEAKKEERVPLVMVVDDSITIRKVTERMLARHGMRVVTAKDGVDAVAKLQETLPDVMLLDIEMPRMDGYEVATHVRNDARLKNLPIIMITSRSGAKHREKAMEIGVNKYLGKPYQEDDLLQNINELLG
jgi:chemosensory pili system protein ChpA (sensor histidine kinase/response regulator)